MFRTTVNTVAVSAVALALAMTQAQAAVITPNSSITISGVNLPSGSASGNTTVGATTSIGGLSFNTAIVHDGVDADWLTLDAVTGQTLAANNNAFWSISLTGLDFEASNNFDSVFFYWSHDGIPFDPINSFGSIVYQGLNSPINPAIGPVFSNSGFAVLDISDFTPLISVSPYSFISSGGMDPATADGFHMGLHFTLAEEPPPVGVPEPGSVIALGSALLGFFGITGVARRRRRG